MPLSKFMTGEAKRLADNIWKHPIVKAIQNKQNGATDQSSTHCERVDDNIARLLEYTKNIEQFSPLELYLLSGAAALHDIGKSRKTDVLSLKKSLPFYISDDHGLLAQELIVNKNISKKLFPQQPYANLVGLIVATHDNGNMYLVSSQTLHLPLPSSATKFHVRPRLLAAVFRLADMLDCTFERSIGLDIDETATAKSAVEAGRECITNWQIDANRPECIYFSMMPENESALLAAYEEINNLNCQMTEQQIQVLRGDHVRPSMQGKKCHPLPYRFVSERDLGLQTTHDVFPVHPALKDMKEFLKFYVDTSRRICNPIRLELYTIDVIADYGNHTTDIQYTLKGKNVRRQPISGILHPIAGDTRFPFEKLQMTGTIKLKHGEEWSKEKPLKVWPRSLGDQLIKELCISFGEELQSGDSFDVQLSFKWPELFSQNLTLWWIDDLYSCDQTSHLAIDVKYQDLKIHDVEGFCVNTDRYTTTRIPASKIRTSTSGFYWKREYPPNRTLNVFACRTENR